MGYTESRNEILDLIEAKYPFLYIVSDDDVPVIKTFVTMSEEEMTGQYFDVITWNIASGLFGEHGYMENKGFLTNKTTIEEKVESLFDFIKKHDKSAIFILQDFDYILRDHKHLSFGLKDVVNCITLPIDKEEGLKRHLAASSSKQVKHVVIVSSSQFIPKELEKMVNLVYFGMPGREEISRIVNKVEDTTQKKLTQDEKEDIIRAGFGLTEAELTNALFKSIVSSEDKRMNAKALNSLKEQIIRKDGILDYTSAKVGGLKNVGGMANLINWIERRKIAFNEHIRTARKLPYPKGIVMVGVQGAGKSHTAKAIGEFLEMPLIRFDIGKVKGKYVGQSEENMRKAISIAEAVSPCVLWIDEIEKAFPDPRNANTHEVSKGLLGYFLTWMQEKKKPVFVVATANSVDTLPPELLRKGRFDEIFWVDLPTAIERKDIFKIHLMKIDVEMNDSDLEEVVKLSEGFSGAEIEAAIHEANFQSAYDNVPVTSSYIAEELGKTTPISVVRKDAIDAMREWAKNNKVRLAN